MVLPIKPTKPAIYSRSPAPQLTFTGYAWFKAKALCAIAKGEVSFYGRTSLEDPFLVEDLWIPKQEAGSASYETDGMDEALYMGEMVDKGYPPENTIAIWCHTHPGNSASPSGTDWDTFEERFEKAQFEGVMFILAKQGDMSAHLSANINGELAAVTMQCMVRWGEGTLAEDWEKIIEDKVTPIVYTPYKGALTQHGKGVTSYYGDRYEDWGEADYYDQQYIKGLPMVPTFMSCRNMASFARGKADATKHLAIPDSLVGIEQLISIAEALYGVIKMQFAYCSGYVDEIHTHLPVDMFLNLTGQDSWMDAQDYLEASFYDIHIIPDATEEVDPQEETKKLTCEGGKA